MTKPEMSKKIVGGLDDVALASCQRDVDNLCSESWSCCHSSFQWTVCVASALLKSERNVTKRKVTKRKVMGRRKRKTFQSVAN